MYSINGKFLTKSINGQARVAIEIVRELDRIVPENYVEIVVPHYVQCTEKLKKISIRRVGYLNPYIWEQTSFYFYLLSHKRIGINIMNSHPVFRPDISYVHDTLFSAYPHMYKSIRGRIQRIYSLLMEKTAAYKATAIISVSEFTKAEIIKYHGVDPERVHVIYNGWQHMCRIDEDETIFEEYPNVKKGSYYLAVSSITPQKNYKWIEKNANRNPACIYIVVGDNKIKRRNTKSKNILYTGRITDAKMKALMHYCKAFIHPAIYEGFGMTPLEAIASGCKCIILSKAACLPEIYTDYACYIDPFDSSVELDGYYDQSNKNVDELLRKYSWSTAAKELLRVMREVKRTR